MDKKICRICGKERIMLSWENTCWSCQKEEDLKKIQNAIRTAEPNEDVDTGSSDYVICPYCGEAMSTEWGYEDFPELYTEGDNEVTCPECGQDFILETQISYYYTTGKKGSKN